MLDARTATWPQIKEKIEKGAIAMVAFGAQEEHGPHCPLATDTIMASGFAERLAEMINAVLLPPVPYGDAWNNSHFPGTITMSFNTVKAIMKDIGISLKKTGFQACIIVNGHFGNRSPIEVACQELKDEFQFPTLQINYPGLEKLAAEICFSKPAGMGFFHADEVETSIVLALEPDTVNMANAVAEYPEFPPTFGSEPITLDSFNRSGVFGDPRTASAEKGEMLLNRLIEETLPIIDAFLKRILKH